jgi:hypothetical protein
LGIECDGATYHSAATARDRDRLRHLILESLGWKLHRIWSTDWWRNPSMPIQNLLDRLEQLVTVEPLEGHDAASAERDAQDAVEPAAETIPVYAEMIQPDMATSTPLTVYRCAEIRGGHPDQFYDPTSRVVIAGQLTQVINKEGPIADAVLFRRVARAWGLMRTGNRIEALLRSLVSSSAVRTVDGGTTFYWPELSQPANWTDFRVADDSDESRRQLNHICCEELVNLAAFILSQHGGTTLSELSRSICRLQRITRTTSDSEVRIQKCLNLGRSHNAIEFHGDTVRLRK